MNRQISHLALFALLLLGALIAATTYWQTWAVGDLNAKQDNSIQQVAQFKIKRGLIFASDGRTVLARSVVKKFRSGQTIYTRVYPANGFAAQTLGYSTLGRSRAGIEQSDNAYLTGASGDLGSVLNEALKKLSGATITGNNLTLNLDVRVQTVAENDLRGKCGAVVLLDPSSGAILTMASSPTYDPNQVESQHGYDRILHSPSACPGSSSALLNRATQGLYPPGSTFKTITAAAALEDRVYTPGSTFNDPGYCTEYGKPIHNALDQNSLEKYGTVSLEQAYEHSINAVFCDIGMKLGVGRMLSEAQKFGFYSRPPIGLPPGEVAASGLYDGQGHLFHDPASVDPGRLAFGQERLLTTPLQMALVASAVANNGVIMTPQLAKTIRAPGGRMLARMRPKPWKNAMNPSIAATLSTMMQAVVTGGTGTAAQIPGIAVAGKTGTAEICTGCNAYDAWFIFFAPADHPKVAGAVVVEHSVNGFGGAVAAPIARDLIEASLRR
jgi:penicillin-binding protein A